MIVGFGFLLLILHARKWLRNPDVMIMVLLFIIFTAGYTWSGINIGMRHWIPSVACAIALACAVLVPEMMAFPDKWRKVAVVVCELAVLQIVFASACDLPFLPSVLQLPARQPHPRLGFSRFQR